MTSSIRVSGALFFAVLLSILPLSASPQQGHPPPAVPVEPIGAIIKAFKTHNIVALSDAHGNEQNHAFRLSLGLGLLGASFLGLRPGWQSAPDRRDPSPHQVRWVTVDSTL